MFNLVVFINYFSNSWLQNNLRDKIITVHHAYVVVNSNEA